MALPDWLLDFLEGAGTMANPSLGPQTVLNSRLRDMERERPQGPRHIGRIPKNDPRKKNIRYIPKTGQQGSEYDAAMQFLNSIGGGGGMGSADIESMLSGEFGPQEQAVDDRYNFGSQAIEKMYNALQGDIRENSGRLGGIYDQGLAGSRGITADSTGRVQGAYDEKAAEQSNLLKTLGITEATPAVQKSMDENEAFAVGNIQQGGAANQQAINSGKTAGLAYNNSRADLAGAEGKAALAELYMSMLDKKSEIDSQRATRRTELATSAGEGGPDVSDLLSLFKWSTEREDDRANQANENLNPYDATYNLAMERLGNPQQARTAMDYIREASMNMDEVGNAGDFSRLVGAQNSDYVIPYQLLTSLANEYYSRMDPREGRNVISDITRQRYGMG